MRIVYVPYGELANATAVVIPYLKQAAALTLGTHNVDDMMLGFYTQQKQLWGVVDDTTLRGILTTEIITYPRCKMLKMGSIVLDTGVLTETQDMILEQMDAFAKENECKGIEFTGRTGWERVLAPAGYKRTNALYMKELSHE